MRFRCWAPKPASVEVVLEAGGTIHALAREADGYWSGLVREASAGMTYRYRLDEEHSYPDPCSRFQPGGPHGSSLIVDPDAFRWRDRCLEGSQDAWTGDLRVAHRHVYA